MVAIAALVGREDRNRREAVAALARELPFHGPRDSHIGDGHFRGMSTHADKGPQPVTTRSPDGICVLCVARFDARQHMVSELGVGADASNADLLLAAYARWGARLVEHIAGDFCFLLWDPRERLLLGATDQFGARPLFYRKQGDGLAIGNALAALRDSGGVAIRLDEESLGQWLALGSIMDPAATMYADIRRLPAAHLLQWRDGALQVSRYWSPPIDQAFDYRSRGDLSEAFRDLFLRAVADRLPAQGPIGILLSGGMDSAAVAAAARHLLPAGEAAARVHGYTVVFRNFPEEEGHYAGIVARHLGIAQTLIVAEDSLHRTAVEQAPFLPGEPMFDAGLSPPAQAAAAVARDGGMLLSGVGADPLLATPGSALATMAAREGWRAPLGLVRSWRRYGRIPSPGLSGLFSHGARPADLIPDWIEPGFVQRIALADRIADLQRAFRTEGTGRLTGVRWTTMLAMGAASQSGRTLDTACPFFDTRLLAFALRLPEPATRHKQVLRDAMAPLLPREIITRPKTPLGLATLAQLREPAVAGRILAAMDHADGVGAYVNKAAFRARLASPAPRDAFRILTAEALFHWLARLRDRQAIGHG